MYQHLCAMAIWSITINNDDPAVCNNNDGSIGVDPARLAYDVSHNEAVLSKSQTNIHVDSDRIICGSPGA